MRDWRQFSKRITRDTVYRIVGFAGLAHETLTDRAEKPTLLVIFAGLIGVPIFLKRDESKVETPDLPPSKRLPRTHNTDEDPGL